MVAENPIQFLSCLIPGVCIGALQNNIPLHADYAMSNSTVEEMEPLQNDIIGGSRAQV